jgi:hypothetical protein
VSCGTGQGTISCHAAILQQMLFSLQHLHANLQLVKPFLHVQSINSSTSSLAR